MLSALSDTTDNPDMPEILLVNFLCTDSIEMFFFNVGDHSGLLYSKIGRAYVMKALTNKSRCLEAKQRWIKLAR